MLLECAAQSACEGVLAVASACTSDGMEKIRSACMLEGSLLQGLRFHACDFGTSQEALFSVLQGFFIETWSF